VTHKALEVAEEILAEPVDYGDPDQSALVRAKTSVITTSLSTQAKVDETRLRRQTLDRLPDLLKLVEDTAKRLPVMIEHEA
jgi:hypothetical protein